MNTATSQSLFNKAQNYIPGGVNSPVRAFKSVGGTPIFIKKAEGAYLFDEDGNRYVELINSWGPMILGHAHPVLIEAVIKAAQNSFSFGAPTRREVEMAELIVNMMPSIEKVRMVNSGTEATMSVIRLARGYTKRDKIIKFDGCYHGHGDSFLIAAGSGAATFGVPDSLGVTKGVANDTLVAPFNDISAIEELVSKNKNQIAALILEPVVGNMGCVLPKDGYLQGLRQICNREGILLIFDEVMTGFRLAKGGAQERFNIQPDLTTLGKIIGGGMPVGAYGGRKEIMDFVSPSGTVYQAGTLSGNPIAMAAGIAMLQYLNEHPEIYQDLEKKGEMLRKGWLEGAKKAGFDFTINQIGSMITLFFTSKKVWSFEDAKTSNTTLFKKYFHAMLKRGVYLAPSQYESLFLSTALSDTDMKYLIEANQEAMMEIRE
ncbi:MAG: glutamate-1-semialdehyde 2,1-aminomutase [Flammeovirgaceae bacterium]